VSVFLVRRSAACTSPVVKKKAIGEKSKRRGLVVPQRHPMGLDCCCEEVEMDEFSFRFPFFRQIADTAVKVNQTPARTFTSPATFA
jgi:hypothetical protein